MKRERGRWRIRESFDWRVVPLTALVIVAAATSYGYHRILLAQRDWIEHTYQVMSTLETTLQLMTDAETGQRGYILTVNEAYLRPYLQAIDDVRVQPAKLRTLVRDSPAQLARVDALDLALTDKLSELARTLSVVREQGTAQARAMILSDVGLERMNRIRMLIAQMRPSETGLLIERTDRASRTERAMLVVTISLAMLSIAARLGLRFVSGGK
ncbi:CHASE3 domain-containing protein [Caballeronia sp. NK8]|uniref:CHASE3 domain-containing protein n=1 Tax=Caballeronia sp. NK8 TaxID=140098 RepID=UPI001BB6C96E|nr:CHASE3 domain-containing protein [Caballeronia sp. NK8]BCQ26201.1 CHASE3 domain-containing protein [Caballeronia sp. NK8]